MLYRIRLCSWLALIIFCLPLSLFADQPVNSMIIFGDSLSDTGNTSHLLKSLRQDEDPAYLVTPLKVFVISKMEDFADKYQVPQMVLDSGIEIVSHFFDGELGPFLAALITKIKSVPVLPAEPYWQARFSNGPVWNEYLAPMLAVDRENVLVFNNQAFGGSWAATYDYQLTVWNLIHSPLGTLKNLIVGKLIPPSLGLVVQAHLLTSRESNDSTVYFIFTGANDYLNALFFEDNYNPSVMSSYIDNVLASMEASIDKLTKSGARHLIIMGLPALGETPKYVYSSDKMMLNTVVSLHNQRLQQRLEQWQKDSPEIDFLYIDIQMILAKALTNPDVFGFSNTTQACIDIKSTTFYDLVNSPFASNFVLQYAQLLQYRDPQFIADERNYHICDGPEHYLFWDDIHPSTQAHFYLANEICGAMQAHGYRVLCQMPVKT